MKPIIRYSTLAILAALSLAAPAIQAQSTPSSARLPAEVEAALARAQIPKDALVAVVQDLGPVPPRLAWQPQLPVNPASLMKLLTTYAALDLLGPAWSWTTPVWLTGSVNSSGVLNGNLVIKGSGDPKLVVERLWLLMRRIQQQGVREIQGDLVLDRSAFAIPEQNPADFDGEPLRPYNVPPDALLLNYKSVVMTFIPDTARGIALVSTDIPLAGQRVDTQVPLSNTACGDWRAGLKADFSDPKRWRLGGTYPASCGEKIWPVAYTDTPSYNERALLGMWQQMGAKITGAVREDTSPSTPPTFEVNSPPLAEVIRDINKFSNNVMAQQLFYTLAAQQSRGPATQEGARQVLRTWAQDRFGEPVTSSLVVDNGSGLSRHNRVTAQLLVELLRHAWNSPLMPELMSSLPIGGIDGTMRRSKSATGRTHLKTGSLRDVVGVAGYVLSPGGQRSILVAIVNHPNANAARPAIDALVQWTANTAAASSSVSPPTTPHSKHREHHR